MWRFDAGRLCDFAASLDSNRLRRALDRITAPTVLVRGADSEVLTKAAANDVLRRLRDGRLAEIQHGSHDLGVQQPEAVAAAVRAFLARGTSSTAGSDGGTFASVGG